MSGRQDDDTMADLGPEGVDPRLERALRDVLDARDPGPAPLRLRTLVDQVPDRHPAGRRRTVRRVAAWLAATAAVVVGLSAGITLLRPLALSGPGRPGATPLPSGIDPLLQAGLGVVDEPNQVLVVGIVVTLTLVAFYGSTLVTGPRSGILAVLVVLIPGAFLVSQVLPPPAGTGGASGAGTVPGSTFGIPVGDRETLYVTAAAGEPYQVAIAVINRGPLPIRLDGMIDWHVANVDEPPSLWVDKLSPTGFSEPGAPFAPMWLAAGDETILWLVQRADACAVGREFDPAAPALGGGLSQSGIAMRWSVLGIVPRMDDVELAYYVMTPHGDSCGGS